MSLLYHPLGLLSIRIAIYARVLMNTRIPTRLLPRLVLREKGWIPRAAHAARAKRGAVRQFPEQRVVDDEIRPRPTRRILLPTDLDRTGILMIGRRAEHGDV